MIENGVPALTDPADPEQLLLDLEEMRERIASYHAALLRQEEAQERVKAADVVLKRCKLKLKECDREVYLLTSRERRVAKGKG